MRNCFVRIPFDQLKSKMTGDSRVSLGKAIQELRPEVDAKSEAKKAERQAKEEIREAEAARKDQAASSGVGKERATEDQEIAQTL
jgi:hypothetical protein